MLHRDSDLDASYTVVITQVHFAALVGKNQDNVILIDCFTACCDLADINTMPGIEMSSQQELSTLPIL